MTQRLRPQDLCHDPASLRWYPADDDRQPRLFRFFGHGLDRQSAGVVDSAEFAEVEGELIGVGVGGELGEESGGS